MQVYSNPFVSIPYEILGVIYSNLTAKHRKKCLLLDKTIFNMSMKLIRDIRIFSPYPNSTKYAPEGILVNILCRYLTAKKLTLGPKPFSPRTGCEGFGELEEKQLRAMIVYLKTFPEQPFRKIELHEITDKWNKTSEEKAELHRSLIESFKVKNLDSIVIRMLSNQSVLRDKEIQPILGKDVKLRKFKLICDEHTTIRSSFSENMAISLSFLDQINLISAKFHHLHLHFDTITSLKACTELETLILDHCYFQNSEIKTLLSSEHPWKLKRLEMISIEILSDLELDAITKQLPLVETLHITLKNVTEEGFKTLSKNCPKLRVLKLSYPTAKDDKLEYLAKYFPNLEMLSFEGLCITEKGIEFLASCTKLRILKIGNLKNLETLCIKTFPQALPQLEVLEITHSELLIVKELPHLIDNMQNLVYLQIKSDQNIRTQEHLLALRTEYRKDDPENPDKIKRDLLEFPPTRKIKQFLL